MSAYLQSGDYSTYGLPGTTAASDVELASQAIDGYLGRPDGMLVADNGLTMVKTGASLFCLDTSTQRATLMLPVRPVVSIISIEWRYANAWQLSGSTGAFEAIPGLLWLPTDVPTKTDCRIRYTAGYTLATLPTQLKEVCARIVARLQSISSAFGSNVAPPVSTIKLPEIEVSQGPAASTGAATLLDADCIRMLQPWVRRY